MRKKLILGAIVLLAFLVRIYRLGVVPPALYWDEASLGYNAFSIAETLHDEHGRFLPYDYFTAFGDYKPPGYIYAAAASVKALGLTEFSVRLPSAAAGTLLVLLAFFLTGELLSVSKEFSRWRQKTGLLAAFLMAMSPWAIQMSRAAFEANLATAFSGAGILFFLRSLRKGSYTSAVLAAVGLVLAIYTFNSHRVFVPLMVGGLTLLLFREIFRQWKVFLVFVLLAVLLVIPLLPHLASREGRLRFNEVTWLADLNPIKEANDELVADGGGFLPKLVHNRRLIWANEFLKHYFDNFRPDFLFIYGDSNPRLSVQSVGEFYFVDLAFLLGGIYFMARYRDKGLRALLMWIILSPVAAAMARETPHALRILNILPAWQIIGAIGGVFLLQQVDRKMIKGAVTSMVAALYLLAVLFYFHNYYFHYPVLYSQDWQYGYKQLVQYVSSVERKYDFISVTPKYGRAYVYFLFYTKYPPELYVKKRDASRDNFGFWTVRSFDKYRFTEETTKVGKWLYIRVPGELPTVSNYLLTIKDLAGKPVFDIADSY